ncbi:MAG: nicotinate phosphoribosyltransferase [Candidatus Omnitrophica bacterium]|nr:nicotinate phosphoribosyltransferase [Candidatus Omnitrophota bacterium]
MSKALVLDLYELTTAQAYFKSKKNTLATFDLFIRSPRRPFYIACGIDDALSFIEKLKFNKEDIDYLRELALFDDDFLDYLKEFKFKGEIFSVEEPEIIFAQEPIMRVSANIIEAQIIESIVLNKINLATTLATKAARVVTCAKDKAVYDFSLRRTQGIEASLACAKYSYMAGAKGTSNMLAGFLYKIPVAGTMAHSYVMSFEKEIDSFLAFAQSFPTKSIFLVDTYEVRKGIKSAIKIAKIMKHEGVNLLGIRLDSGNFLEDSKYARSLLDQEGLIDTIIVASGNLDEYKIEKLVADKAPIDAFGVGTNMGCSSDLPYTDVLYKLVEIKSRGAEFMPTMKFSPEKLTLPSKKQVFRVFDGNGIMQSDSIGLCDEKIKGKKLMRKIMDKGVLLYKEKDIMKKKDILVKKMETIPSELLRLENKYIYPVKISKRLSMLTKRLKAQIKKRISGQ